ncbi:hypothetical protein [Arcanobacterium hippocoleae]|uniref:hypothetical protein n=1 Tax=Arcanobacterium hippocoleae TaxID=149017 RepID=UPI00333E4BC2
MDHESPIPSYAPKHHTPRPNANGAKRVGKGPLPASHSGTLNQQQSELKSSKSAMPPVFRPSAQNTSHSAISADSYHSRKHSHSTNPDASAQIPAAPIFLPQQTATTAENHHQVLSSPSDAAAAEVLRPRNLRRKIKLTLTVFATIILLTVISIAGWGYHLYNYGTDRMHKIAALSGAPDTPGTTYLIAGSDQRHGAEAKEISGKRSDTIMLLHLPESGTPALISLRVILTSKFQGMAAKNQCRIRTRWRTASCQNG